MADEIARTNQHAGPPFSREALLLALMVVAGLGLRVLQLGLQPLWWDEGYSV
jgi:hypothetical protein